MELTTNLTAKDFTAYSMFVSEMLAGGNKPGGSSFSWLNFSFVLAISAYCGFFVIFYGKEGNDFDWLSGGAVLIPSIIVFSFIVVSSLKQQKSMTPLEGGAILGGHHYEFTEQGIREETLNYSSFTKWATVRSVVTYQEYVFILIDTTVAHIIPCRTFSTAEDVRAFVSFVEGYCCAKN